MPKRTQKKQQQNRQRQNQFLRDAAQEFTNDRLRQDYEENEISLGRLPPTSTKQQEEEEEEDASSLSSSASSSDASSSSCSSEDSKIKQQQQVVLESAKEYLYDHKGRELLPIQSEPRKVVPRQHYNLYKSPKHDLSQEDDDSLIQNPQWYHRKRVLHSIILILLVIAVGTAYECFVTVEAYEHQEHGSNNNLRGGTEKKVSLGGISSQSTSLSP